MFKSLGESLQGIKCKPKKKNLDKTQSFCIFWKQLISILDCFLDFPQPGFFQNCILCGFPFHLHCIFLLVLLFLFIYFIVLLFNLSTSVKVHCKTFLQKEQLGDWFLHSMLSVGPTEMQGCSCKAVFSSTLFGECACDSLMPHDIFV